MTRRLPTQLAPAPAPTNAVPPPARPTSTTVSPHGLNIADTYRQYAPHLIQPAPDVDDGQAASSSKLTFVVTGANRGIGLGLAKALSKVGHIIATARKPSSAPELKSLSNVSVVALDISSESSVAAFAEEVAKLAPDGIDLLWNNAGMNAAKFAVTDDKIDAKGWVQELAVNCVGGTLVTNALLPLLKKGKGEDVDRKIVFTSSVCGSVASTSGSGTGCAYFSSKAALNSSVKFWHYQLAEEGFLVTPIHPGWVKTDMGGPGGQLTVEESVTGMLKVIKSLDSKSELKLRVWDGSTLPW